MGDNPDSIDGYVESCLQALPAHFRVAVIGSTDFWHPASAGRCLEIGSALAALSGVLLLTGGMPAVGEAIGRGFHATRLASRAPPDVFHLLPEDADWHWDYGLTLSAGRDMHERREVLGRVGEVFVCVEGGPGTEHEARVALGSGALVIPLASSGGFARELFHGLASPRCVSSDAWEALQRDDLTASEIGRVIARLVAEVERDQHS